MQRPTPRSSSQRDRSKKPDGPALVTLTDQHTALRAKDKSGFICRVKFRNELPPLPFEPKFLTYPMDPQRLTKYTPTALEKAQKHALLTEPDLGIHIDLIEPEAYDPPATGAPLLEEDNELLLAAEEPDKPSSSKIDAKARPNVPWLHKTAYYGNDDLYGFQQGSKPIVDLPIPILQEVKELTPKQLAEKVNETFDAPRALDQLKHPFKKDITPVETWEVFPDRERWANDYAELVFDQDPVADDEELKKASGLIRKRVAGNAVVHLTPPENPAAEDDSMTYSYFLPAPGVQQEAAAAGAGGAEGAGGGGRGGGRRGGGGRGGGGGRALPLPARVLRERGAQVPGGVAGRPLCDLVCQGRGWRREGALPPYQGPHLPPQVEARVHAAPAGVAGRREEARDAAQGHPRPEAPRRQDLRPPPHLPGGARCAGEDLEHRRRPAGDARRGCGRPRGGGGGGRGGQRQGERVWRGAAQCGGGVGLGVGGVGAGAAAPPRQAPLPLKLRLRLRPPDHAVDAGAPQGCAGLGLGFVGLKGWIVIAGPDPEGHAQTIATAHSLHTGGLLLLFSLGMNHRRPRQRKGDRESHFKFKFTLAVVTVTVQSTDDDSQADHGDNDSDDSG